MSPKREKRVQKVTKPARRSSKFSQPLSKSFTAIGTIKRHADGFGFLITDNPDFPDVYIPKPDMFGVMTSDRVEVSAKPEGATSTRFRGSVIKIVERGLKQGVGKLHLIDPNNRMAGGVIKDQGHGWGENLIIPARDLSDSKDGDLVIAQIVSYPGSPEGFRGKVVGSLGDHESPMNDIFRVLHTQTIPIDFPKDVIKESEKISDTVQPQQKQGRKNLTGLQFITIDGVTAKDFDDAIFVKASPQGFEVFVAIADVSTYVPRGSKIDEEAMARGTSVYLPNYVVPMLPEKLSNGICSLMPNVERLALVAEMVIDFDGSLVKSTFYEAIIRSKARVTYGEAQEVLEGTIPEKLVHVEAVIKKAAQAAKILMKKRFADGSLDLNIPETQLVVDEAGEPIDIIKSERLFSHRLIEELMLIANVAAARFIQTQGRAGIFRVHDGPKADDLQRLQNFMRTLGAHMDTSTKFKGKIQKSLTQAIKTFENTPEAIVINMLTLRSISQAQYAVDNIGHFGLGFSDYTHFTSPIRRYPDLIVHRLIKSLLLGTQKYPLIEEADLRTIATQSSSLEQRAVKAERMINGIKKARFMRRHLGESFDGVVSSVTKFGIFVMLRAFDVDGLVSVDDLFDEPYVFDEESLSLVGKRSGFTYRLGDRVSVTVVHADTESGNIDFSLSGVRGHASDKKKNPSRASVSERSKAPKDSQSVRKAWLSKLSRPDRSGKPGSKTKTVSRRKKKGK